MTKSQCRRVGTGGFGFRHSDFFRHSAFVILRRDFPNGSAPSTFADGCPIILWHPAPHLWQKSKTMTDGSPLPTTYGQLRSRGYRPQTVKAEMRRNLLARLQSGGPLFPGIVGYDETVIPQIENAMSSQHDMLFLGLRGQGKTRMLRMLVNLLDDAIPIVAGSEINDSPFEPLSKYARDVVAAKGDDCPIEWVGRDARYHEKLAT